MTRPIVLALLAGAALMAAPVANAADPAGFVTGKRGEAGSQVRIVRDGRTVKAVAGTPVYAGDVVRVSGAGNMVMLRVSGRDGTRTVKPDAPYTVPTPTAEGWGATLKRYASSIGWALGLTDRESSRGSFSRSGAGETSVFEPLLKPDLLDAPVLWASHDQGDLLVRWCGDMDGLVAEYDDWEVIGLNQADPAFGTMTITNLTALSAAEDIAGPERLTLMSPVPGHQADLVYPIEWIGLAEVPRPDGLAVDADLSAEAQMEWAMWLLDRASESGDKSYNLIALNLLHDAGKSAWPAAYLASDLTACPSDRVAISD